jgi:hypothetical protein
MTTLEKALSVDKRTSISVHEDLDQIFGALADFKERNPLPYEFLCANSGDLTQGDAIQALAQTFLCIRRRVTIMQATITLPRGYGHPTFTIGQRTKQGIITGIDLWALDKFLTCEEKNLKPWTYLVQARVSAEITYLEEHQIEALLPSEIEAEILAEVDLHLMKLVLLQQELKADLKINTPFGKVNPPISIGKCTSESASRRSEPIREKIPA